MVVGKSNLVGRPMAQLLLQEECTVTVCHAATPDVGALAMQADIIVVATGHKGLVRRDESQRAHIYAVARPQAWTQQQLAKDLLQREPLSVSEVAARVGYEAATSFTAAFSRQVGVPPRRFAAPFRAARFRAGGA